MTHGPYSAMQPMGHGLYGTVQNYGFPMTHELHGTIFVHRSWTIWHSYTTLAILFFGNILIDENVKIFLFGKVSKNEKFPFLEKTDSWNAKISSSYG